MAEYERIDYDYNFLYNKWRNQVKIINNAIQELNNTLEKVKMVNIKEITEEEILRLLETEWLEYRDRLVECKVLGCKTSVFWGNLEQMIIKNLCVSCVWRKLEQSYFRFISLN